MISRANETWQCRQEGMLGRMNKSNPWNSDRGLLKSAGTGKGIDAPGRFPWEGCNNHLKDHLKVVSRRQSITVLFLSSQGKPTWLHFYRYLCGGCINPQTQSILLTNGFSDFQQTYYLWQFWQANFFYSGKKSKSLLKPVGLVNAEDSSCVHDLGDW